ncbi:hypothetical protein GCK72_025426 [Caenorhabditis remanei]|uniref:Uncharacterized protein n=1 Tax=Caenorhabditis remanei TaxID=31234 RepID=A0A6A5G322_CAERE|nr:hypothetical protein GCK72_025426 [Caenorhabditis remanei]KAF1748959.1 hypothetical protein GCK72_025426 [Caenorhabditis remanei]
MHPTPTPRFSNKQLTDLALASIKKGKKAKDTEKLRVYLLIKMFALALHPYLAAMETERSSTNPPVSRKRDYDGQLSTPSADKQQ